MPKQLPLAALALLGATIAQARAAQIPLPNAVYLQALVTANCAGFEDDCGTGDGVQQSFSAPGRHYFSGGGPIGSGEAWTNISPHLGPSLTSRAIGTGVGEGAGTAQVTYYFQVVGPSPATVPMIAEFTGYLRAKRQFASVNAYDIAGTYATISVNGSASATDFPGMSCPYHRACGTFDSGQFKFTVTSSSDAAPVPASQIVLQAASYAVPAIDAGGTNIGASSITAALTIDPSWPNAGLYRIKFSQGIAQP